MKSSSRGVYRTDVGNTEYTQILPYSNMRKALILSNSGATFLALVMPTKHDPADPIGIPLQVRGSDGSTIYFSGEEWMGFIQGPLFAFGFGGITTITAIETL